MSKNKYFPCPYCARSGKPSIEPGECVDMGDNDCGSIMVQIAPDIPCGACDGTGFIPVGSEIHFKIKCSTVLRFIDKTFEENTIELLIENKYKKFWGQIYNSLQMLKNLWLKQNSEAKK